MLMPYETTYGSLLNTVKLKEMLTRYINISSLDELEFEYPSSNPNTQAVFITGYNDEEKEFPVWDHPIVITTLKGVKVIVSDIRKYVRANDELPARLDEVIKDKNSAEFVIMRALISRELITGNVGVFRVIYNPTTTAMGVWLSGMINTIVNLDPVESFNVEIITSLYANTLYMHKEDVSDNMDIIIARVVASKHAYKFNKKEIIRLCNGYVVSDGNKLEELIDNISKVLPEEKSQFVTVDSLISVMGNVWYGPGTNETPIMALESIIVWNSILYSVITNRSYAKSRIGTLLNRYNRVIDSKTIEKFFTNFLKEAKVV